jgi:lysozyme family protein
MIALDSIIVDILHREGWPEVTNRPADDGGLTKGGITFSNYAAWARTRGRSPITPIDFPKLTEKQAHEFLTDSIAGPIMPVRQLNEDLFVLMFDWATTSGPDDPTKAIQSVLRTMGADKVLVDGHYGAETHRALRERMESNSGLTKTVYKLVAKMRVSFYIKVALRDADVAKFRETNATTNLENLNGWVSRALEFL